eukprot:585636-Karenia_brevis.AAC.1
MHVNFKRGKTEALIAFRGHKAKACKASIVKPDGTRSMSIPLEPNRLIELCVSDSYKHLGSHVAVDGNLVHEAKHRVTAANGAYSPIAYSIL